MLFFAPAMPAASAPQASSPQNQTRQTAMTARLVRQKGQWQITLPCPPELAALQTASTSHPALVPSLLQPGKTLSGKISTTGQIVVPLADDDLVSLLPGTNTLTLMLPGYRSLPVPFDAAPLFTADADWRTYAAARLAPVPFLDNQAVSDSVWSAAAPPMQSSASFAPPILSGISFSFVDRKLIAVGSRFGQNTASLTLSAQGRKLYLLLLAEHNSAGTLGTLSVFCTDGTILTRPLTAAALADWRISTPPKTARAARTENATFNVIEVDLGETRSVESLLIRISGKTALGLAGVQMAGNLKPGAYATLPPKIQKLAAREPITLFAFDAPSLAGWETSGKAWGTTDTRGEPFARKGNSRWFADSKAGGEQATGSILSPPFVLTSSRLTFLANGHSAQNFYSLVDAASGAELKRSPVPEKTGAFEKITWDVKELRGRRVRFKATDGDNRDAYAWLAFDAVTLEP
jgi:hypothetical protein